MQKYPEEFKKELRPELSVFPGVTMTCGDLTATCDDYESHFDNVAAAIDELFAAWNKQKEIEGSD